MGLLIHMQALSSPATFARSMLTHCGVKMCVHVCSHYTNNMTWMTVCIFCMVIYLMITTQSIAGISSSFIVSQNAFAEHYSNHSYILSAVYT